MEGTRMQEFSMEQLEPLIREQLASGGVFCFSPRGNSMRPMLREGKDTVALSSPPDKLRKYDLPLYRRDNGQFILHRVVEVGETYTCMGDNQFLRETGIRRDQIIALVTAFERNGKRCQVTSPAYWSYCRLWYWSRPLRFWLGRLRRFIEKKDP